MASNALLNMRVTANSSQGHRKYMEDCYKIRFQKEMAVSKNINKIDRNNNQQSNILFSYFAIFDGHGGAQASQYCKQHLYWSIIRQEGFWSSDDDSAILNAIKNGFVQCHNAMWSQLPSWPRTASGLPSTSGTTATVVFIKKNRVYVGHVGDSGLVIAMKNSQKNSQAWEGLKMTRDHKPEDPKELKRILEAGGDVQIKSGVNRVVWNRPVFNKFQSNKNLKSQSGLSIKNCDHGDICSSTQYESNYLRNQPNTPTERIPFLAVARSLGDLWSYSATHNDYVVSPVPDTFCFDLDPTYHKCLILATDGLWNVMSVNECVEIVRKTDCETHELTNNGQHVSKQRQSENSLAQPFVNPSQRLVQTAIQRCCEKLIRADNTTCITIMLDLPNNLNETSIDKNQTKTAENFEKQAIRQDIDTTSFYHEADDELVCELDLTKDIIRCSKHLKSKVHPCSSTMLPEAQFEREQTFSVSPSQDKRSRSLTSLRRRHWSASSNRSSSVVSTVSKRNDENEKIDFNRQFEFSSANSTKYIKERRPTRNSNIKAASLTTNSMLMNNASNLNNEMTSNRQSNNRKYRSNKNVSISNFVSSSGKQIKQSMNDLLNVTNGDNKSSIKRDEESSKENKIKLSKALSPSGKPNGYSKRLKRLKNTLIKTKNTIFNRKLIIKNADKPSKFDHKSISSPSLNLTTVDIPSSSRFDSELNANQSFIDNFRSRFIKRSRSTKLNNSSTNNLNSTTISKKLSNTIISEKPISTNCKRPRFF